MIKSLAHLCVFSNNLERSLDFYVGTLGLQRHFDFHKDGKLFGFYLQVAPGQFIEIFRPQRRRKSSSSGFIISALK